jgi:hypothetical protein
MTTKLTLYSDKNLVEEMKTYAKMHNTSVSKIVNTFFFHLLQSQPQSHSRSKITDSLTGILKGKEIDHSDYHHYLEEKYL